MKHVLRLLNGLICITYAVSVSSHESLVNASNIHFDVEVRSVKEIAATRHDMNIDLTPILSTLNKIQALNKHTEKSGSGVRNQVTNFGREGKAFGHLSELEGARSSNKSLIKAQIGTIKLKKEVLTVMDIDGDQLISFVAKKTVESAHTRTARNRTARDREDNDIQVSGDVLIKPNEARAVIGNCINESNIKAATHIVQVGNTIVLGNGEGVKSALKSQLSGHAKAGVDYLVHQAELNALLSPAVNASYANKAASVAGLMDKGIDRGLYSQNAGTQGTLLNEAGCNYDPVSCAGLVSTQLGAGNRLISESVPLIKSVLTIKPSR